MKLLFCSDLHIRGDIPVCRIDDFQKVQMETLKQIFEIALENGAMIIIAGDLFHRSKETIPNIISYIISIGKNYYEIMKVPIYLVFGQHCVNYQNINEIENTNVNILLETGYFKLLTDDPIIEKEFELYGYSYGEK